MEAGIGEDGGAFGVVVFSEELDVRSSFGTANLDPFRLQLVNVTFSIENPKSKSFMWRQFWKDIFCKDFPNCEDFKMVSSKFVSEIVCPEKDSKQERFTVLNVAESIINPEP